MISLSHESTGDLRNYLGSFKRSRFRISFCISRSPRRRGDRENERESSTSKLLRNRAVFRDRGHNARSLSAPNVMNDAGVLRVNSAAQTGLEGRYALLCRAFGIREGKKFFRNIRRIGTHSTAFPEFTFGRKFRWLTTARDTRCTRDDRIVFTSRVTCGVFARNPFRSLAQEDHAGFSFVALAAVARRFLQSRGQNY